MAISKYVEQNLSDKFKADFNPEAVKLSDPEFLFYFADIMVEMIQYNFS